MSTFLINYRVGDIVDIKANAAQQKGMPHKFYHGFVIAGPSMRLHLFTCWCICRRTGIVYNVTPSAVGVIVNKVVGNRYIEKRVNVRVEHIRHSACRQAFLDRVQRNHAAHVEAKEKGGESEQELSCLSFDDCWGSPCATEAHSCPAPRIADGVNREESTANYGSCSV
jgi:ribosomal protein L21E